MSDKGITLEGLAAAVDTLRQELATWKALARKQDTLTAAQITATQSGATAAKIDQIAVNTAAIQALSAQVAGQISLEYVTTLPAAGEPFTLYLVPQGDGTAPNFCNEYLWVNNAWELIGTTGSMANNGELVIQVNGVAVGTFTANQAANTAVNITVPTNTNQLVNGAQYVDAAALQTALALKQNNLNAAQLDAVNSGITAALVTQIGTNTTAIAGKQDALTTAQQAAVDSGATAAKIGQIATNAAAIVSLTSSKQDTLSTAQLAAVNSGITSAAVQQISTNTGAIATKAADSDVVHLAGTETISGDKTWTGNNLFTHAVHALTNQSVPITENPPAEIIGNNFRFIDNDRFWGQFVPVWSTDGSFSIELGISNWTTAGNQGYWTVGTKISKDFATLSFYASHLNTNLGTSTNQWASVYARAYYYNGTAWGLDRANVWTGENSFNHANLNRKYNFTLGDNSYQISRMQYQDKNGIRWGVLSFIHDTYNTVYCDIGASCLKNDGQTVLSKSIRFLIRSDNTSEFKPINDKAIDLGTSSNKWKTLNGINPGALSLPSAKSDRIAVDITNWDKTNYTINSYSVPVNGWMAVAGTAEAIQIENNTRGYGSTFTRDADTYCEGFLPVGAGDTFHCRIKNGGTNITAFLYPCLGNV